VKTIDLNEYTNSELEEMGIPLPCECLSTYLEDDERTGMYEVCVDCGASALLGPSRRAFPW